MNVMDDELKESFFFVQCEITILIQQMAIERACLLQN